MRSEKLMFDSVSQHKLLVLLANFDYIERYLNLCQKYKDACRIDGPRLKPLKAAEIFRENRVSVDYDRRFKVFTFDREAAVGWEWEAKLVVQRYDMLEPMLEGVSGNQAVGSTWLSLAIDAGDLRMPPVERAEFIPPAIVANRPQFDGDMRTMECMIPDLINLFRFVKDVIRASWLVPGGLVD